MNDDKRLAVELSSSIICNLGNERYVDNGGKPIEVKISSLLQSCYKAVKELK